MLEEEIVRGYRHCREPKVSNVVSLVTPPPRGAQETDPEERRRLAKAFAAERDEAKARILAVGGAPSPATAPSSPARIAAA